MAKEYDLGSVIGKQGEPGNDGKDGGIGPIGPQGIPGPPVSINGKQPALDGTLTLNAEEVGAATYNQGTQTGAAIDVNIPSETQAAVTVYGKTAQEAYDLDGGCTQETSEQGKNLWGGDTKWPVTAYGITTDYDPVTDEYIMNGTATGRGNLVVIGIIPMIFLPGQKITISATRVSGSVSGVTSGGALPTVDLATQSGDSVNPRIWAHVNVSYGADSASKSFTVPNPVPADAKSLKMRVWLEKEETASLVFNNLRFKVQVEVGEQTPWERFTPQMPSPKFPSPVYGIGERVNLLPQRGKDSVVTQGVTYTKQQDGSVVVNGTATGSSADYMVIGAYFGSTTPLLHLPPGLYTIKGAVHVSLSAGMGSNVIADSLAFGDPSTFTVGSGGVDVAWAMIKVENGRTVSNLTIYPMLNRGSTALPYSPYYDIPTFQVPTNRGLYELDLDAPLYGMGDITDRLVLDVLGGKAQRKNRFAKIVLDGTEGWERVQTSIAASYRWSLPVLNPKHEASVYVVGNVICSHYKPISSSDTWSAKEGISPDLETKDNLLIYDDKHAHSTLEEWKSYLAAQAAAGTPVTVIYEIETPTSTPVTARSVNTSTAPALPMQAGEVVQDPDLPVSIVGVGESGSLTVRAHRKNLWGGDTKFPVTAYGLTTDYDPVTDEYVMNGTVTRGDVVTIDTIPMTFLAGQKITISAYRISGSVSGVTSGGALPTVDLATQSGDSVNPRIWAHVNVSYGADSASKSFTVPNPVPADAKSLKMRVWLEKEETASLVFNNLRFKVQVEVGEQTPWQRYTPVNIQTVPLSRPLYNLSGGIHDTCNLEEGKVIRRVGRIVLDGTEGWKTWGSSSEKIRMAFALSNNFFPYATSDKQANLLSTHYPTITADQGHFGGFGVSARRTEDLIFDSTGFSDSATWKSYLAAEKAAGTPVTIIYELAEPTEEHFPPAYLDAYPPTAHLYTTDQLQPEMSATILESRAVSVARNLSGYAAAYIDRLEQRIAALESTTAQASSQNAAMLSIFGEQADAEYQKAMEEIAHV